MGLFKQAKPRGYQHSYIYHDERKEKLAKMEEKARQELGIDPPKEFDPESIRGKFVESTTHLKRRKQSKRKPIHAGMILIIIVLLMLLWHFLQTGSWSFL